MRTYFLAFTALAAFTSAAGAQPASASAQAESLYRQGQQLLTAGKVAEACATFESSQKIAPATTTLFATASCREKNNQLATAWGLFVEVQRQTRSSSDPTDKQLGQLATKTAAFLEPRLSQLTIAVPTDHAVGGLEIKLNNDLIIPGEWNHPIPLDGGTYQVSARAPGQRDWTTTVTIKTEKDQQTVTVPALDAAAKPPATVVTAPPTTTTTPPPTTAAPTTVAQVPATGTGGDTTPGEIDQPPASSGGGSLKLPIALGVTTIALAGAAVGFELWAEHINNQIAGSTSNDDRTNLWHSANWHRYTAEGLGAAAVVGLGATVWFYFHRGNVEVTPVASAHSGGVSLSGRF